MFVSLKTNEEEFYYTKNKKTSVYFKNLLFVFKLVFRSFLFSGFFRARLPKFREKNKDNVRGGEGRLFFRKIYSSPCETKQDLGKSGSAIDGKII